MGPVNQSSARKQIPTPNRKEVERKVLNDLDKIQDIQSKIGKREANVQVLSNKLETLAERKAALLLEAANLQKQLEADKKTQVSQKQVLGEKKTPLSDEKLAENQSKRSELLEKQAQNLNKCHRNRETIHKNIEKILDVLEKKRAIINLINNDDRKNVLNSTLEALLKHGEDIKVQSKDMHLEYKIEIPAYKKLDDTQKEYTELCKIFESNLK